MAAYENTRYQVISREWAEGCFIFDLHDKKTGKTIISYSDNLKKAAVDADFYEAGN